MNDQIREKLSAYLDGALPDAERQAVELEIARSEDMRLELEALRAVSSAVKGLPREKLPDGFAARLESRRAREGSTPPRDYFILPPAYRPLAFALSTAVVALVVWDRTQTPDIVPQRVGWDGETVGIKSAAEAPPSFDVSGRLAAMEEAGSADKAAANELTAKKEDDAAPATLGKQHSAPGKPLEIQESEPAPSAGGAGAGFAALSAPAPADSIPTAPASPPSAADTIEGSTGYIARNEEERSAINERLYKGFEEEKKRMGIARIVDKDAEETGLASGGRDLMALQASPEAPSVAQRTGSVGAVRGASGRRSSAPIVKALALKTPEALLAAWAAAGLAGEPPAVKFPGEMAVFLACPPGCGIVSVQSRKKLVVVLYKDTGYDDPSARVRALASSEKPVVVKRVE